MKLTEAMHACSHSKDMSSVLVARHDICLQVSWESAAHVIPHIISSFYTKQQIHIFRIRVCVSAYMCVLDIQKSQTGGVNIPCLCEIWLTQMSGWLFVWARDPPRSRRGWFKEAPCQLHVKAADTGVGGGVGTSPSSALYMRWYVWPMACISSKHTCTHTHTTQVSRRLLTEVPAFCHWLGILWSGRTASFSQAGPV